MNNKQPASEIPGMIRIGLNTLHVEHVPSAVRTGKRSVTYDEYGVRKTELLATTNHRWVATKAEARQVVLDGMRNQLHRQAARIYATARQFEDQTTMSDLGTEEHAAAKALLALHERLTSNK